MANTILVTNIPEKVVRAINKEQSDLLNNAGIRLNQSKVIIKMLRDYIRCQELNNFKSEPHD